MAIAEDIRRVHERIDALDKTMAKRHDEIVGPLSGLLASCEICRPIVMGNGGDAMDKRVDRLEIETKRARKWFWLLATGLISVISASATAFFVGATPN